MLTFILPVFLIIALVATLPIWRHSKKWGFYPISGKSDHTDYPVSVLDRPFVGEKIQTLENSSQHEIRSGTRPI